MLGAQVRDIFDHGFSRVPVFSRQRQHVVGLLFVKDLIFVDPEDGVPLAEYLRVFERSIELVDAQANLDDVLRIFKRGRGHLALVLGQSQKPSPSECLSPLIKDRVQSDVSHIVGLVTLEDIIEEILGDEIIDETDVYVDVDNHVKVENRLAFARTRRPSRILQLECSTRHRCGGKSLVVQDLPVFTRRTSRSCAG